MTNAEALALFAVQRRLRRKNYVFDKYIDHALFAIEDITFNSIFIRANSLLHDIAKEIGTELPTELVTSMKKTEHALNDLWDDYAQEYFSRDFVSHRLLKISSIGTLLPLYAGCITKERAAQLVKLLENEHRFGPAYPIPSVPLDSPWYQERRYWQGPTWINTNWLVIDGLRRYGFHDHADALQESTVELVQHGGFYEYFSALDGRGAGTDTFSWTAALVLDMLRSKTPK
jgi:glycogen debranching enzyme